MAVAADGKTLSGEASITFLIFKDELGGEPLWAESQSVAVGPGGHYAVQLGAASPSGLPADLFSTGEARWLEVQIAGQQPQPRILLASVPYALKAGDAATLGGLPVSAFALAGVKADSGVAAAADPGASPQVAPVSVTTPGGKAGYLAEFAGAASIEDSPVFVSGANVGIGTATPTSPLDVVGATTFQGSATLAATGRVSTTAGANSEPLIFDATTYGSLAKAAIPQQFEWKAEAAGNDSILPSATLNLLAGFGSKAPTETGFYFSRAGVIHFAAGQTFPGTGTITGVTAGTGLTGGGTTGNITLNLAPGQFPVLTGNNTFTGNQVITGTENVEGGLVASTIGLPATTNFSDGVINIGGVTFLQGYGAVGSDNVFVGGAGNFTTTGTFTTGVGFQALKAQTTGSSNTSVGLNSLIASTTGSNNTAIGAGALYSNTTGANNTAVGWSAGAYNGALLSNTTAIGAGSQVQQDNTVVLGNTTGTPGAQFVNVGIGTANPISALEASVSAPGAVGAALTLTNPGGDTAKQYGAVALDFNTQPIQPRNYNPGARIEAVDDGANSDSFNFLFNQGTATNGGLTSAASIDKYGVTIAGSLSVGNFNPAPYPGAILNQDGIGLQVAGGQYTKTEDGGNGVESFGSSSGTTAGFGGFFEGGSTAQTGGDGIYATRGTGTGTDGYAGDFFGDVFISGSVVASSKNFKIDHPQDPANKYLVHASIESSEMVNIYSGNVVTDELGNAVVKLPDWFEAENGDFRYQLTVLGGRFAQAIVSTEIHDHQFTISTNATGVKVSWQVTGVRQDAYAKAHPLVVEEPKGDRERGFYIHPELYGQPEEKQTTWARHPEMMRRMKARREAALQMQKPGATNAAIQPRLGAPASAADRKFAPVSTVASKPPAEPKSARPATEPAEKTNPNR
jgi:hypothetical protein